MARKPDPKSKAGFVRSLPASMSGAEVVKKAKDAGLKLDVSYVYSVRTAANRKGARKKTGATVTKRGPASAPNQARSGGGASSTLVAEIERIVEAKVTELLKARLGTLFG